eukprot:8205408-Alexandrium_andersonii.AAC.1
MRNFCQSWAGLGNTSRISSSRHVQQLSRTRTTRLAFVGVAGIRVHPRLSIPAAWSGETSCMRTSSALSCLRRFRSSQIIGQQ